MKKYIFLSLLIHVGIATALISWSGLSVSEWTQSLLSRFSAEQLKDELMETQEESIKQMPMEKKLSKKLSEKKLETKKKAERVLQKKTSSSQMSKTQSKPAVRKKTRPKKSVKKISTVESSLEENSAEERTRKENVSLPAKLENKDNSADEKTSSTAQEETDLPVGLDSAEEENLPEVKYNSVEDLKAVDRENTAPSEALQEGVSDESASHSQIEPAGNNLLEAVSEDKVETVQKNSESPEDRDFEEINTNPQDLKKIITESSQKEVKSSQTLVPVPGNPEWSYPQQARQNKKEGSVFLQYFVDDTGFVDKIKLLKSSGYSILDNEALRVMARQKYRPGQSGWYRHRVDFKLKNM